MLVRCWALVALLHRRCYTLAILFHSKITKKRVELQEVRQPSSSNFTYPIGNAMEIYAPPCSIQAATSRPALLPASSSVACSAPGQPASASATCRSADKGWLSAAATAAVLSGCALPFAASSCNAAHCGPRVHEKTREK